MREEEIRNGDERKENESPNRYSGEESEIKKT